MSTHGSHAQFFNWKTKKIWKIERKLAVLFKGRSDTRANWSIRPNRLCSTLVGTLILGCRQSVMGYVWNGQWRKLLISSPLQYITESSGLVLFSTFCYTQVSACVCVFNKDEQQLYCPAAKLAPFLKRRYQIFSRTCVFTYHVEV